MDFQFVFFGLINGPVETHCSGAFNSHVCDGVLEELLEEELLDELEAGA